MDYQKEFWDISRANLKNKTEDSKNRVVSLANLPSLYLVRNKVPNVLNLLVASEGTRV